jgi:hypothetical protein
MRKFLIGLLLLSFSITAIAQGKFVRHEFTAASLQNNKAGENPSRQLTVYLPPDYEKEQNVTRLFMSCMAMEEMTV